MERDAFLARIARTEADEVLRAGLTARAKGLWWFFKTMTDLAPGIAEAIDREVLEKQVRFAVYPASLLFLEALALIPKARWAPLLEAFYDTHAEEDRFEAFPRAVHPPEAITESDAACVLIFHPLAEDAISRTIAEHAPELPQLRFFSSEAFFSLIRDQTERRVRAARTTRAAAPIGDPQPLRVVMINSYGPSVVLPDVLEQCSEPACSVTYLHPAELGHFKNREVTALDCGSNLWECAEVIEAIEPDLLYVQDNALYNNQKAPILMAGFPEIPFIYEPYDLIAALYADPGKLLADGRSRADLDYILAVERYMLSGADGVVHMDNGPQIDRAMREAGANALERQPYLPERHMRYLDRGPGDPIHLVWAGGIAPDSASDETRGENKLLPFFQSLIRQGFRVTAFNALVRDVEQLEAEYATYLAYAETEPRFAIHPFTPRETLIDWLSREADYGMHLYPKPKADEARGHMYQSSMAGKVFTYLSAGIPLLCCDFLEPIARYVTAHGVGVSITEHDFDRIGEILRATDYAALKRRVHAHMPAISTEGNTPLLETFILSVLQRARRRGARLSANARRLLERAPSS